MLCAGLAAWLAASCAAAGYGGDWAPAALDIPKLSAAVGQRPVHPAVTDQMLGMIEDQDFRGLGAEAKAVGGWVKGRQHVVMLRDGGGCVLMDAFGASRRLSPGLGSALERLDQYMGATLEAEAYPIRHAELRAAVLSPQGVRSIAAIFERSIADSLALPGSLKVLEVGGEAVLGRDGIALREYPEPNRPLLRQIAQRAADPVQLDALFKQYPEGIKAIDERGILRDTVSRVLRWRGDPAKAELSRDRLALALESVMGEAASGYVFEPANMLEPVAGVDWKGRYIGRWHTHPPYWQESAGWMPSDPGTPSDNDMDIAIHNGQNLTLKFEMDGFDLYDLSPLAGGKPDASKILKISYRSARWLKHFKAVLDAAASARR